MPDNESAINVLTKYLDSAETVNSRIKHKINEHKQHHLIEYLIPTTEIQKAIKLLEGK